MVNFTSLYRDEASQVSYYYNLDDGDVYREKKQIDQHRIAKMASCGAFMGAFLSPYIGNAWVPEAPLLLFVITAFVGILLGGLVIIWFNHAAASKVFVPENKLVLSQAEIIDMYQKGKKARKKYWLLCWGWLIFSIISSMLFCHLAMNVLYFLCCIIFWAGVGLLFFAARPICRLRFRKLLRQNRERNSL